MVRSMGQPMLTRMNSSRVTAAVRQRLVWAACACCAALALTACGKQEEGAAGVDAGGSTTVHASDLHPCKVTGTQLTVEDCSAAQYWLDQAKAGTAAFSAPTRMLQGQTKLVTLAIGTAPPPPPEPEPARSAPAAMTDEPKLPKLPDVQEVSAAASQPASSAAEPSPAIPASAAPSAPAKPVIRLLRTPHQVASQAAGSSSGSSAQVIDYYPFVGRQMSADLTGEGFDIKSISQREQPLSDGAVTTWEWQVTARDYGKKTLIVKTAVVMMDSQGKPVPLKPTTEFKEVTVWIWFGGVLELIKSLPDWLKVITAVLAGVAAVFGAWKSLKAVLPKR